MKILHVNASDVIGGAARAAHRIHMAQVQAGMDSHMLVIRRNEPANRIHAPLSRPAQLIQRLKLAGAEKLLTRQYAPTNPTLHSINYFRSHLSSWINASDFEIINLHWLGLETLAIEEIGCIRQPVVWTMHDMWPFSGAEHYDDIDYPGRYRTGYTSETRPEGYLGLDIDAWVWRRKRTAWKDRDFQLISPSQWLAECARSSTLMARYPCAVIPNCVDTEIFKPIDRRLARYILNLNPEKRYILFGAIAGTNDRRKGFHLLHPALQQLAQYPGISQNTELIVFGANAPASAIETGLPTHYMGHLNDDVSLAVLYAAADVFVAPSMQDNLPNTVVEAMASGTPCVAFSIGGMTDMIDHGVTGLLVPPFEIPLLSQAMYRMLQEPPTRDAVRQAALCRHRPMTVAHAYQTIYTQVHRQGRR